MLTDLGASLGGLPTGAWNRPPHQAVAVPLTSAVTCATTVTGYNILRS